MLRHLERRLGGRPLSSMFDLIVGTSTGAIQAVSLGMLRYTLDQCEGTYTKLGHKVGRYARDKSLRPIYSPLSAPSLQAFVRLAGLCLFSQPRPSLDFQQPGLCGRP